MQSIDVWLEVVCSSVLALGSVLVALSVAALVRFPYGL